jgi:type IV secretion system protein TrbI
MSEPVHAPEPKPKQDPEALVLRGRPRRAVRFRRGLIVGAAGALAAALVTLSWFALEPPSFRRAAIAAESDEPAGKGGADALADVPRSYGDVPRLGPPLPGDLGRPILDRQRSLADGIQGEPLDAEAERVRSAADAELERLAAARQAARASPLIVQLAGHPDASAAGVSEPVSAAVDAEAARPPAGSPSAQQSKVDFARGRSDGDVNPHQLGAAPSRWTLSAGTVIPASLVTGLDSDLPGTILAQVSENVRDSATGRLVLVPQGARLIGSYDSAVSHGQRRALLVWTRIVMPDGSSVRLDNMPATDASGYAGLEDRLDGHGWQFLKGIALSTLLGVGTQLSLGGSESDLVRALRQSSQQNAANAGDRITSRNLDVPPTIKVRPGWPVRVLVNKDLVLEPWRE